MVVATGLFEHFERPCRDDCLSWHYDFSEPQRELKADEVNGYFVNVFKKIILGNFTISMRQKLPLYSQNLSFKRWLNGGLTPWWSLSLKEKKFLWTCFRGGIDKTFVWTQSNGRMIHFRLNDFLLGVIGHRHRGHRGHRGKAIGTISCKVWRTQMGAT